jgi:Fe2+ or Zn2+ uptake regulation protein
MHDEGEEARERRVQSHSTRAAILDLLARDDRELTVTQIRDELSGDTNLRDVYYHLRVLRASKLLTLEKGFYKLS